MSTLGTQVYVLSFKGTSLMGWLLWRCKSPLDCQNSGKLVRIYLFHILFYGM